MSTIVNEETIWYPGIYGGRTDGDWDKVASSIPFERLVELVQTRAKEDGEWTIENGFVGDNEDKMRRFMAFVSDEKNIRQCLDANLPMGYTVDWICRDLANASKWVVK